jgi:hypothetical protein
MSRDKIRRNSNGDNFAVRSEEGFELLRGHAIVQITYKQIGWALDFFWGATTGPIFDGEEVV